MDNWDSSLETGDALVDQQHRQIHQIFDDLGKAGDSTTEIIHALDRLMSYVEVHFATEEDLMRREDYPARLVDAHRAEHVSMTNDARALIVSFRQGELTSTAPIQQFVGEWLARHVHECDRELVDYVQQRGGEARLPEPWASDPSRESTPR